MAWPRVGSRHWNFYVATVVGVVAAIATLLLVPELFPAIAASAFSLTYLGLTAKDMPRLTPKFLRERAVDEDAPPLAVFLLTLGIVVYVMIALFMVVNDPSPHPLALVSGLLSVVLAWFMIHTMWGMHYAWEYYENPTEKGSRAQQAGGIEFPGEDEPDGMDFIYFSFVVAMTAQTSDADVTSRDVRRIVIGHSLFSYFFNTVTIAAAVNVVVSLGK
jgi:uncharacterized membrane protein